MENKNNQKQSKTIKNNQNKFMFYDSFLTAIEQLPEEEQAFACLEFCRYGITGILPKNKYLSMFCLGVQASVHKYQGRGGLRDGAGAPMGNKNAQSKTIKNNQNNQNNQNNHNNQNTQTETETETYTVSGSVDKYNNINISPRTREERDEYIKVEW